jgi:hypothetical protein
VSGSLAVRPGAPTGVVGWELHDTAGLGVEPPFTYMLRLDEHLLPPSNSPGLSVSIGSPSMTRVLTFVVGMDHPRSSTGTRQPHLGTGL